MHQNYIEIQFQDEKDLSQKTIRYQVVFFLNLWLIYGIFAHKMN